MKQNFRPFFYIAFSVLLGVVLAAGLGEALTRVFAPDWLKRRVEELSVKNDTDLGFATALGTDQDWPVEKVNGNFRRFLPDASFQVRHYEYETTAHTNALGLRASPHACTSHPRHPIPFTGDSFTFGLGVEDEETFIDLLNKQGNRCFLNFGIPGSSLKEQLDILKMRHKELGRPKVYIFGVFVGNELSDLEVRSKQFAGDKPWDPNAPELRDKGWGLKRFLKPLNSFIRTNELLRRSFLVQFVKAKLLALYNSRRVQTGGRQYFGEEVFYTMQNDQHFKDMFTLFTDQLNRLKELSQALHFKYCFVLIPDRHQVDDELRQNKVQYYDLASGTMNYRLINERMGKEFTKRKIRYVDLLPCLREKFASDKAQRFYYSYDNHFTAQGHLAAFECMEKDLAQNLKKL